jgi:hypothetical protein
MKLNKGLIGLGSLDLPVTSKNHVTVYGGPYREKPAYIKGVKMAEEINLPCEVDIPTRDFQVPDVKVLRNGLIKAVAQICAGEPLYVGCWGGRGRTGLFLAVLAKAFGVKNPVEYVRKNYYRHAVETEEQYAFVSSFAVTPHVRVLILAAKFRFFFKKGRITRYPPLDKLTR